MFGCSFAVVCGSSSGITCHMRRLSLLMYSRNALYLTCLSFELSAFVMLAIDLAVLSRNKDFFGIVN
jgi:uncharacterized membrane protein